MDDSLSRRLEWWPVRSTCSSSNLSDRDVDQTVRPPARGLHPLQTVRIPPLIRQSIVQSQVITSNSALRMVYTKPPTTQPKFLLFVRYTFRTQAFSVSPRDIAAIEHLLRKGSRQLDGLEQTNVKGCWVSKEMEEWDCQTRAGDK